MKHKLRPSCWGRCCSLLMMDTRYCIPYSLRRIPARPSYVHWTHITKQITQLSTTYYEQATNQLRRGFAIPYKLFLQTWLLGSRGGRRGGREEERGKKRKNKDAENSEWRLGAITNPLATFNSSMRRFKFVLPISLPTSGYTALSNGHVQHVIIVKLAHFKWNYAEQIEILIHKTKI